MWGRIRSQRRREMKNFTKAVSILIIALLLVWPLASCSDDDPPNGFAMSVNKANGYHGLEAECEKNLDGAVSITASGVEVLECVEIPLIAPSIMTVTFNYKASASTCYNRPCLEVLVGDRVERYYFDCDSSGDGYISIELLAGQTLNDVSFVLHSGDWGSSVRIKEIVFTPK